MHILYRKESVNFTDKGANFIQSKKCRFYREKCKKKNTQKNKSYIKESVYFSTKNVQKKGELFM